jgi:hypothetical protein
MILTGMMPISNGNYLVSGGELFIKASQNGQLLNLSSQNLIQVKVPAGSNPSLQMSEFYADTLTVVDTAGWTPTNQPIQVINDSINPISYYVFTLDYLNWVNCDHFYLMPNPKTAITINVNPLFNQDNCKVYISFDGKNAADNLFWNGTNNNMTTFYCRPIAHGVPVTFLAIGHLNNKYYYAMKSITVNSNTNTDTLNMQLSDLNTIKMHLSSLP